MDPQFATRTMARSSIVHDREGDGVPTGGVVYVGCGRALLTSPIAIVPLIADNSAILVMRRAPIKGNRDAGPPLRRGGNSRHREAVSRQTCEDIARHLLGAG